jgi:hypothetical protein
MERSGIDAANQAFTAVAGDVRVAREQVMGTCGQCPADIVAHVAVGDSDEPSAQFEFSTPTKTNSPRCSRRFLERRYAIRVVVAEHEPKGKDTASGNDRWTRQVAAVHQRLGSFITQQLHGLSRAGQIIMSVRENTEEHNRPTDRSSNRLLLGLEQFPEITGAMENADDDQLILLDSVSNDIATDDPEPVALILNIGSCMSHSGQFRQQLNRPMELFVESISGIRIVFGNPVTDGLNVGVRPA